MEYDDMVHYPDEFQTVVIDAGSSTVRAGLAGDDAPRAVFPSVVGRPKDLTDLAGMGVKYAYIGDEIGQSMRHKLIEQHPIERGLVTNWDDMTKIWHHIFYNELRVDPEEQLIYMAEMASNPKKHREKMTEIMFETFNVQSLCLTPAAVMSLFANFQVTGVVLSSGGGITQAVPIYDTHPIQHGISQLDIGGNDVTEQLIKLIDQTHKISFTTRIERAEINFIKTKCTFVAQNYEEELQNANNAQKYDVFDGHITLQQERFQAPEILFKPQLFGLERPGVHEMIFDSVMKSDESIRQDLLRNIVLEGGNTNFPGFKERLERELRAIVPENYEINVLNGQYAKEYSAWIGGSMVGTTQQFLRLSVTKQHYDEIGPRQINWRCF